MERLVELYQMFEANLKDKSKPKLTKEQSLELVMLLKQAKASGARVAVKKPKGKKAAPEVAVDLDAFMKALNG